MCGWILVMIWKIYSWIIQSSSGGNVTPSFSKCFQQSFIPAVKNLHFTSFSSLVISMHIFWLAKCSVSCWGIKNGGKDPNLSCDHSSSHQELQQQLLLLGSDLACSPAETYQAGCGGLCRAAGAGSHVLLPSRAPVSGDWFGLGLLQENKTVLVTWPTR